MEDKTYDKLWKKANALLNKNTKNKQEGYEDAMGILQELNIYKVELDMQNEELLENQRQLVESRKKYIELYDSAPIAYLTIGKDNLILEANSTSTKLFRINKSKLKGTPFSKFIARESQDVFYLHKMKVLKTMKNEVCKLELSKSDGTKFNAMLQSIAVRERNSRNELIRVVITDITDRKR